MKKMIIGLVLLLSTSTSVIAAGPFDGIYALSFNGIEAGFASIHEKNGVMVAIALEASPFDSTWEAMLGPRNGNSARLSSVFGTVSLEIDVTFNDDNSTGTATVLSCSGDCDFPNGTVLNLNKIF